MNINRLEHRLKRFKKQESEMISIHKGNEQNYTYHAGFSFGYLRGKIDEIEDRIDDANEANEVTDNQQTSINYDGVLAAFIERGDTVHTKYGIGSVVDIVEWGDGIAKYIEYYVETNSGNYKLTRGEIRKLSVS